MGDFSVSTSQESLHKRIHPKFISPHILHMPCIFTCNVCIDLLSTIGVFTIEKNGSKTEKKPVKNEHFGAILRTV